MADDRKKMLEALAAKRKAEAQGTTDRHKKPSSASSFLANPAAKLKSSPGADKKHSPAPLKKKDSPASIQKPKPAKEAANPKKKRRVEKYESEDDDDEDEESDGSLSSEEEDYKKPAAKPAKGHPAPSSKGKPSVFNGKGKESGKEKAKKKKADSDSDEVGSEEEVASDASDDFGVDPSNILPSRTRRSQGVRYDFTGMSDGDDDSD